MLFSNKSAHKLRAYLVRHTPELGIAIDPGVSVAIVNTADKCGLACSNCIFSAALTKRVFGGSPPFIHMGQMERFVKLMNEAGAELLVFSGGGESYENMDAMCYAVEHLRHIRQVVTITSAYFAESQEATMRTLNQLTNAMRRGNELRGSEITFTLRISYDTFHKVPTEYILHAIEYALTHGGDGLRIRLIIRTILDPSENMDIRLADQLGGRLVPEKNPRSPTQNLPIIDAFPTRWILIGDIEIPVIYKPTYFLGLAQERTNRDVPGTSWREIKAAEEIDDGFFNLSLRGTCGEGHNFYETVSRGYKYWSSELEYSPYYITSREQQAKRLSVYMPADGRLIINASSPDSWQSVETVSSWSEYWKSISADVLQRTAVTKPTDILLAYAKEVEPNIDTTLDERNFVFHVPYTAMETTALRLYLTIRLLQDYATHGVRFTDPIVCELIHIQPHELADAYRATCYAQHNDKREWSRANVMDPIIGNHQSIWMENANPLRQSGHKK